MRKIDLIVVHCSATYPDMNIGAVEIDKWHKERGWSGIGYHYVVKRDGTIEEGRPVEKIGAHAHGFNSHSIGVCWVGGLDEDVADSASDNRTEEQRMSMLNLLGGLKSLYPDAEIVGHRDLPRVTKSCPCFDAKEEYSILNNSN